MLEELLDDRPGARLRRALHAGGGARARAGAAVASKLMHARGARGDRRARSAASASPPGFGRTLSKLVRQRHRRAPRRDAAALPPPRRAARADRPAEGHLRHRHARRRHQRPDPHRRSSPGLAKFDGTTPAAAQGARVPPDRRPRRARRVRHRGATSSSRRPSTSSTNAARVGQGRRRPQEAQQGPAQARPPDGVVDWTEETFERLRRRRARAARLTHARRPRDDPQRRRPAGDPVEPHARAAGGQPRGRAQASARLHRAGLVAGARSCSTLGRRWSGWPSPTPTAARCALAVELQRRLRPQPAAGALRAGRVRRCSTRSPTPTRSTSSRSSRRSSTTRARC